MDGERSVPPAGQDGGYVPPDLVSTQRFWAIPGPASPPPAPGRAPAGDAGSAPADERVVPPEDVLVTRPGANGALPVPMAAAAPPRLPSSAPAPPQEPAMPGPSRPGSARKPRASKHIIAATAAAIGVVAIGAGVSALWPAADSAKPAASGDGTSSASAPARTQRGGPSPGGTAQTAPTGGSAAEPLTRGRVVSYATTTREQGYFEGVLTLTNRTGAPLGAWQVSFTYPGAYVKSVWGGVLVRAGSTATISGTAGAGSIPVGGTVRVKFGAAGTPSAPRGCTLNGGPC
ncbi:MAG TPA: cellulose binding domain-containing protein [Streptosporangiaceae bacterium]|nr:cellulose binding domain-containing protein [Streptosporangiaceae bacterium]